MNARRARELRRQQPAATPAPARLVERCEHGLVACKLCGTLAERTAPNRADLRRAGRYPSQGRGRRYRALLPLAQANRGWTS